MRTGFTCAVLGALLLGGCAAAPTAPVVERVDERTAVTVTTLPRPLLYSGLGGAASRSTDLAFGPVEINRMGGRSYFVWVAVSGADIGAGEPRLRLEADGRMLVELAPLPRDFALPVSQPPYPKPVAWATERWYAIDRDGLLRLRGQGAVRPSLVAAGGEVWQFEPWEAPPDALDRYVTEQVGDAALSR